MRRGLRLTSWIVIRDSGHERRGDDERRRRREVARHVDRCRAGARRAGRRSTEFGRVRRRVTPAARSISSVWSRVGAGSITVVRPSRRARRAGSPTSPARSRPAARSRSPCSAPPVIVSGRRPSVVSICAPIRRSGSAMRSIGRAESDSSPVSVNVPSWKASRPDEQARERARVAAVDRRRRAGRAGRRRARSARRRSSSTATPSARTAASVDSVSPRAAEAADVVSPSETAPSSSARCEIDLSPGTARWPSSEAAGSIFTRAPARRRRRSPAPRASRRRAAPPLAGDEQRQRAAALGRDVVQLEVLDVDALGAERLRDAGEHARPVGDVHAQALQLAGVRVLALEHPAAVAGGLADPAREKAGVALLERRLDLLDAAPVLGERAAERARRCRGRCRPRCAGSRRRCASCRAASRRRARAARARRRAIAPAWLTTTFASTCGTWLVSATSRSCAAASIATGVAPSVGDEAVHEPVPLGIGLRRAASGTRSRPRRGRRSRSRRRASRSRRSDARRRTGPSPPRPRRRSPSSSRRR